MFVLSRNELPETSNALAVALEEAVREVASGAKPTIMVRGRDLGRLDEIVVDLSGAVIDPEHRPVIPKLSKTEPAILVHKLSVSASPVKVLGSKLIFNLVGSNVQFNQARTADGKVLLILHQASSGEMRVVMAREQLERLIAKIAAMAAAEQGVTIDNVQVDLRSCATRTLEVKVALTVRKFLFRANLCLSGTIAITDDLHATASGLRCEGDGTLAALVCAAITPQFSRMEERAFPLSALPIGEIRVNELAIAVDDKQIVVEARFGSQSAMPS